MEFKFDINIVLPLEITIINGDYRVLNHGHAARISYVLLDISLIILVMYFIELLTS
jgi:hypothetical protein